MGAIVRLASGAAVLAIALLAWPATVASAAPAEPALGLELRPAQPTFGVGEPVRLLATVRNGSAGSCALAAYALGTIQVLAVEKDGTHLRPTLSRGFYDDGLATAIGSSLATVEPGKTVDLTLTSVRVDDAAEATSIVLRSVTATSGGGGLETHWPVGASGQYQVTVNYAVPAVEGELAPCAGTSQVQTVSFAIGAAGGGGVGMLWLVLGAVLVLAAIAIAVVVLLRRRHASAAVLLILAGLLAAVGGTGRPAYADYEVDPDAGTPVDGVDFTGAVNGCLAGFAKPGGDPSGILGRLKDKKTPRVRIIPTTGGSNTFETPASKDGKGSSTVTWNPTSTEPYSDGVPRDPCSALYHELSHADDISKNNVPQGDCGDTGIKKAEVKATFSENRYRKAKGLDPRQEYDGKKLPSSYSDCNKPAKKKPPQKGPVRLCEGAGANQCGSTNGDPHLITFDRTYYDFQAVGEFVLVKSTVDDLEVQTRQAPLHDSRTVSVNTAVGLRVAGHTIGLALAAGVTHVYRDGKVTDVPLGDTNLPGGGVLTVRESDIGPAPGYDVRWPDGSGVAVDQIGDYGYRLLVKLVASRSGAVRGLLGDFDGDPSNDLALPSGATAPAQERYKSYAEGWRISQDASLLPYAEGETTATFTDRTFPDREVSAADLDPQQRDRAQQVCRWAGVSDVWQLQECVFDVAVSGRLEFALSSASTELIAPPVGAPPAAKPVVTGTLVVGGDDRLTFTGHKADAVFVDIFAPTMPDQCSPVQLVDPDGAPIGSACTINGEGYIDRTDLPADGEYTLRLDPDAVGPGKATLRVYVARDVSGLIEPNAAPLPVVIEQPGALASYQFSAKAGQRAYAVVADSTLPSQCSPLRLRDPEGALLGNGCVINGFGDIDGVLLSADGTYTVEVNPSDRTTGSAQLQVYLATDSVGTIAPDGSPVTATIDQPGRVARYEFTGTAGASVTVVAADATLANQCSPLQLRDPRDELVANSCVINGEGGIENVTLPTSGRYTIVVDPYETVTGSVTLTVRMSK